jgi:hypothetical protein
VKLLVVAVRLLRFFNARRSLKMLHKVYAKYWNVYDYGPHIHKLEVTR